MYVSYFHRYRFMREKEKEKKRERERMKVVIKIVKLIAKLQENNLKLPKLSRK